jgi:hypothetical protein
VADDPPEPFDGYAQVKPYAQTKASAPTCVLDAALYPRVNLVT